MGYSIYIDLPNGTSIHLGKRSYGWPFILNFSKFIEFVKALGDLDESLKEKFCNFEHHWNDYKCYHSEHRYGYSVGKIVLEKIYHNRQKLIDWAVNHGFTNIRTFLPLSSHSKLNDIIDELKKYFFPGKHFNFEKNLPIVNDHVLKTILDNTPENRRQLEITAYNLLGIPCVGMTDFYTHDDCGIVIIINHINKHLIFERLPENKHNEFYCLIDNCISEEKKLTDELIKLHMDQSLHPRELCLDHIFNVLDCAVNEVNIKFHREDCEDLDLNDVKSIIGGEKNITGKELIRRVLPSPDQGIIQGKILFTFSEDFS